MIMLTKIINMIFRKKDEKHELPIEDILTEERKKQIDKIWNNLDKMSGYGQSLIVVNTQENDLAIALAHSKQGIVKQFMHWLRLNNKWKVIALMKQYENSSEDEGYKMKSHIINTHRDRFHRAGII
jgi:hypothetical protein